MTIMAEHLRQLIEEGKRNGRWTDVRSEPLGDGTTMIRLNLHLPDGWTHKTASICFKIPCGYPVACPDTSFWAQNDLRLKSGVAPAYSIPPPCGASRHGIPGDMDYWMYRSRVWTPNSDNLVTVINTIRGRFTHLL